MLYYIARRLFTAVLLTWGAVTLVFSLLRVVPGDITQIILGEGGIVSPEIVHERRVALGLDQPMAVQYGRWISGIVNLDLGKSLESGRPIAPDIAQTLPRTLELAATGVVVAILGGVPVGIVAARNRGYVADWGITTATLCGLAVPNFVSGTLLVLCFGLTLKWFPTAGYVSFAENPLQHLRFLLLPGVALGIPLAAITARFTRSAMVETMGQDYIRTALAKGLSERYVNYRHALKNALIPVVTVIGLEAGSLLGGTIIVEFIFNWPGLSTLLLEAAYHRDYPVVQAVVLVIAMLFLVLNLAVDLVNAYMDPRIRYS